MGRANESVSPIETAVGGEGDEVTRAFELLGNETRLAIVLALWEAFEPHGGGADPLSFKELRERVGVRDSGQFNYHLEKLVGTFAKDTGDGYVLTLPGRSIVEAVISGAGIEDTSFETTEIDTPCPLCGSPSAIGYRDEILYQVCTTCDGRAQKGGSIAEAAEGYGGLLYLAVFDPAGLSNRSPEEMFEASVVKATLRNAMQMTGVCPRCSGAIETSIQTCDDHDVSGGPICHNCGTRWGFAPQFACTVCKHNATPPPTFPVNLHPDVIDFYADHGVTIGDLTDPASITRIQSLLQDQEAALVSRNPPEIRVTIRHEGEVIRVTYDAQVEITDVTRERDR